MTPNYCKAARALLDWTQADLARVAKVSLSAVKSFEAGFGATRAQTVRALSAALESGGVVFGPGGGVRLAEESIQSFRFAGPDCIQKHNEMIYAALRTSGEQILTCSPDDSNWTGPLARKANAAFQTWRKKLNIRGKTLTTIGSKAFNEPRHQYRFLTPETIGVLTYVIYSDKISFILWKQRKVFVLQNALIVETFRKQFTHLWTSAASQ